ncbi:hypothetical protein E2C01_053906 [Portunus trituberculatus]|uniref:Uncharacterized protein n=1 Tax=Portunus trituberculatus TaxID=210409 RepID=A0A5B7GS38_PORTR|nr:hypothetical protein [Portunus trituberculatus]
MSPRWAREVSSPPTATDKNAEISRQLTTKEIVVKLNSAKSSPRQEEAHAPSPELRPPPPGRHTPVTHLTIDLLVGSSTESYTQYIRSSVHHPRSHFVRMGSRYLYITAPAVRLGVTGLREGGGVDGEVKRIRVLSRQIS